MTKLFKYFNKKERFFIGLAVITVCIQVWLNLKIPDYMTQVTKLVESKNSAMSQIWEQGGLMLLCAIGSALAAIFTGFFAAQCAAGLARTLRSLVYNKTIDLSMQDVEHYSTASLVNRSTNDITQIQNAISTGLSAILMAPIMAVWAILKIMGKAWQWSAITAGSVVIIILFIIISVKIVLPRFKKIQGLTDNINRIMREQLTGIRVVRAYNAEDYQETKFDQANDILTNNNLTAFRTISFMNPLMQCINSGLTLAIYWMGAWLISASSAGSTKMNIFADMVVFSQYAMQIVMAFMLLSMVFFILPRAQVSAGRVQEILQTEIKIKDGQGASGQLEQIGEVQFKDVYFQYPEAAEPTLKHINFTAHRGQTVAFIGATGSGKTTLLNLIPRFYDATQGEVLIDGENVKNYRQNDLHDKIGFATQKAMLMAGTVKSNIQFGESKTEITDDDVQQVLDIAQANEFVSKMNGQENAKIAQGGSNVSGGQKQRLAIARAIARKPEILVFDDSFSALDYETDRNLRRALNEKLTGVTQIIVAQRIGTIKDADKIIVLDHGQIVGQGKHEDLLQTCPTYQEIAASQLSKKELEDA
jgi:ATP-binding cassette subfamily B protein